MSLPVARMLAVLALFAVLAVFLYLYGAEIPHWWVVHGHLVRLP